MARGLEGVWNVWVRVGGSGEGRRGWAGWVTPSNGQLFVVVCAMSCPEVCDDHDAIYVLVQHRNGYPLVTFPNEPVSGRREFRNAAESSPFERRVRISLSKLGILFCVWP